MSRSFWILMTYVTRPMMWLVAVAMLAGGVFLFQASLNKYEDVDVGVFKGWTPIRRLEHLQNAAAHPERDGYEIDWGGLAHEQLNAVMPRPVGGRRHIGDREQDAVNRRLNTLVLPKNTVAIHTHSWGVDQDVVDRMGEITSLERLGFLLVGYGDDPLDLSPLADLKNLQVLDLGITSHNDTSLAPLSTLSDLKTLSLRSHQWVSDRRMVEIARLPALELLYLPDISENQRAMAALEQLRKSSTIQEVRVAIPLDQPEKLAAVQAQLPNVTVRTSKVYQSRIWALVFAVWTTMQASLLGLHYMGQFSLPQAEITPGFKFVHQRVAWGMTATIIITLTIVVCTYGANWLPVASLVTLCIVTGIGDSVSASLKFGHSGFRQRLSGLLAAIMFFVLLLVGALNPILIEEYLMSRGIMLPILLLVISSLFVYRSVLGLNHLCRSRIESGRPAVLTMQDVQQASIEMQNNRLRTPAKDSESAAIEPYERQGRLAVWLGYVALLLAVVSSVVPQPLYGVGVTNYAGVFCGCLAFWSVAVLGINGGNGCHIFPA